MSRLISLGLLMLWPVVGVAQPATPDQPTTRTQPISPDQPAVDHGKLDAVTVFRNQASVTRVIEVPATAGVLSIRVPELPEYLITGTAHAVGSEGVVIRSLQIVDATPSQADDEQSSQLEAKQEQLAADLSDAQNQLAVIEQDLMTLEKLVDFSADKVRQNLDRATLDVQSVTDLADFTMQRRRALATELQTTQLRIATLQNTLQQNLEAQEKQATDRKEGNDALLNSDAKQGGTVRLTYDVGGVNWAAAYTLRCEGAREDQPRFSLRMIGEIVQNSGEDWADVEVTLSTAEPDRQSSAPVLTPLRIFTEATLQASSTTDTTDTSMPQWQDESTWQRDMARNQQAGDRQVAELRNPADVRRELAADATLDVIDETYSLVDRIDLPSRPESQSIVVATDELDGGLYRVATPLLSSFVYQQAEIINTLGRSLIAGPAEVYLDDRFVGQAAIPPTAAGQKLYVGFGIDRQIRTRRELMSQQETIRGGNRLTSYNCRLVVMNYHESPVEVRLYDRIPISTKDGAIAIQLDEAASAKLSADPLYDRLKRPTGILRWDVTVPADSFGAKAYDFDYGFSIEMDRQQQIVTGEMAEQMRRDYEFEQSGGGGMGGGMGGGGQF